MPRNPRASFATHACDVVLEQEGSGGTRGTPELTRKQPTAAAVTRRKRQGMAKAGIIIFLHHYLVFAFSDCIGFFLDAFSAVISKTNAWVDIDWGVAGLNHVCSKRSVFCTHGPGLLSSPDFQSHELNAHTSACTSMSVLSSGQPAKWPCVRATCATSKTASSEKQQYLFKAISNNSKSPGNGSLLLALVHTRTSTRNTSTIVVVVVVVLVLVVIAVVQQR